MNDKLREIAEREIDTFSDVLDAADLECLAIRCVRSGALWALEPEPECPWCDGLYVCKHHVELRLAALREGRVLKGLE